MGNAATILATKGTQVFTIEAHRTAHFAVREMTRCHVGSMIVVDKAGRLKGIITERDILRALGERSDCLDDRLVEDLMSPNLIVCTPETPITELRMIMKTRRIRHLPVLDDGELVGVVSIGDVNAYLIAEEEIEIHWLHQYILGQPLETPLPGGLTTSG